MFSEIESMLPGSGKRFSGWCFPDCLILSFHQSLISFFLNPIPSASRWLNISSALPCLLV
jgi:hypothetical protein